MSYDTVGIRIGASGNQAATVVAAAIQAGKVEITEAEDFYNDLMRSFYMAADKFQKEVQPDGPPTPTSYQKPTQHAAPASDGTVPRVKILGKQHGDIPEWLHEAAYAKGVPAVFDNRVNKDGEDITQRPGKQPPWFRSPRDARQGPADVPFWPPKR